MVRYYSDLGKDYFCKKKYDISIEYNQKALDILQKLFGGENSYQAQIYYNIGLAFSEKIEIEKAISYYEKALSIFLVYCNNNDNFLKAINYELGWLSILIEIQ
jgi:tetratricopeptide (TPR) repeat protein